MTNTISIWNTEPQSLHTISPADKNELCAIHHCTTSPSKQWQWAL